MGRTFVFVWAFTLPLALVGDINNIYASSCALFLMTYGFIGIELISIELDDPFGDDPNDLDVMAMAQVCSTCYFHSTVILYLLILSLFTSIDIPIISFCFIPTVVM